MGEHSTWFDFLNAWGLFRDPVSLTAQHNLERTWKLPGLEATHFTLAHVFGFILVACFLVVGALVYRGAVARGGEAAIVPPPKFGLRNLFEMFCEGVLALGESVMG